MNQPSELLGADCRTSAGFKLNCDTRSSSRGWCNPGFPLHFTLRTAKKLPTWQAAVSCGSGASCVARKAKLVRPGGRTIGPKEHMDHTSPCSMHTTSPPCKSSETKKTKKVGPVAPVGLGRSTCSSSPMWEKGIPMGVSWFCIPSLKQSIINAPFPVVLFWRTNLLGYVAPSL